MTDEVFAAVTYVGLPIASGGAHRLGRMSRRAAYERTMSFLAACTSAIGPLDSDFRIHDVPSLAPDPRFRRDLDRRFENWMDLAAAQLDEALDFLDGIDPQPANEYGMAPVWLSIRSTFLILDPETGRPLPGQDPERFHRVQYDWGHDLGSSELRLILNNHAAIAFDLCIPNADGELIARIVPWLQRHLPFRLSPSQWRSWTPTKAGSFKGRKLKVLA